MEAGSRPIFLIVEMREALWVDTFAQSLGVASFWRGGFLRCGKSVEGWSCEGEFWERFWKSEIWKSPLFAVNRCN